MTFEGNDQSRCGHTEQTAPPYGGVCCWRPTWRDYDKCIWHTRVDEKPVAELSAAWTSADERLDGAVVRGVDISETNISLRDCCLASADLSRAESETETILGGTECSGAIFHGANLQGADLSETQLIECDFTNASLVEASLRGADLRRATVDNLEAVQTDLTDAYMRRLTGSQAYFEECDLSGCQLGKAQLPDVRFRNTTLADAVLNQGDYENSDFQDANCTGMEAAGATFDESLFRRSTLDDAHFGSSSLKGADLRDATGENARFTGARLDETILKQVRFTETDLSNVSFDEVSARGAVFRSCTLDESSMEDSEFVDADLTGSSLVNCHLNRAQLEDAILTQTDLRGAQLIGTYLYQAVFSEVRINDRTTIETPLVYEDGTSSIVYEDEEPLAAAAWIYRQLERVSQANALSESSRDFHIRRAEAKRKLYANHENWPRYIISSVNNVLTRHGESPWRVIAMSILCIAAFSPLYLVGGVDATGVEQSVDLSILTESPLTTLGTVVYFSAATFVTLGANEISPIGVSRFVAILEASFGVLLLSLLVFVLGRQTAR